MKGLNEEAIKRLTMAYEADPTFHVALLMAGIAAGNAGQGARADSLYARVAPHKDRLSPYYRFRLEAQMAGRAGNLEGYLEGNRKAAALGPGTKASYNLGRHREAAAIYQGLAAELPDGPVWKAWAAYLKPAA